MYSLKRKMAYFFLFNASLPQSLQNAGLNISDFSVHIFYALDTGKLDDYLLLAPAADWQQGCACTPAFIFSDVACVALKQESCV